MYGSVCVDVRGHLWVHSLVTLYLFEEPGGLIWLYLTDELQGSTRLCPSKVKFHHTGLFTWTQGF